MKKPILLIFVLLLILDLYHCTTKGQEISIWLRPFQVVLMYLFVFKKIQSIKQQLLVLAALLVAAICEHLFYRFGSIYASTVITLIIVKNFIFVYLLYQQIKNRIVFSKRLLRWGICYITILVIVRLLIDDSNSLLSYIVAVQSGLILLFISLQSNNFELFGQQYLGYGLIIMSLVFGKILINDFRWFVEVIHRLAFLAGHTLFVCSLVGIKLLPIKSNTLGYQTVD